MNVDGGRGRWFRCACLYVLPSIVLIGCGGGGSSEPLLPVEGIVVNGSSPLTSGSVMFHPDKDKGNEAVRASRGEVTSEGTYELFTEGEAGAPAGWYKVTVFAQKPPAPGDDEYAPPVLLVAEKYTLVDKTELAVEVRPDAPAGHYDLVVQPQ